MKTAVTADNRAVAAVFAPVTILEGASFKDMVELKGKTDIGDQINKKIIAPLVNANKLRLYLRFRVSFA